MATPTTTTPSTGWRRAARIGWRFLKWTSLVVVLLVGIALGLAHTDWGRDKIREQVSSVLASKFRGPVHIGRLEGSIFTELVARNVTVDEVDGTRAVTVGELGIKLSLLDLVSSEVHLDQLRLSDVTVEARMDDRGLNLGNLFIPNDDPLAWDINIDKIVVDKLAVSYQAEDLLIHLDGAAVRGSVTVPRSGPIDAAVELTGVWRERNLPIQLSTTANVDGPKITVPTLTAALGTLTVAGSNVSIEGDSYRGELVITAPAAGVAALGVISPIKEDVTATVTVIPSAQAGTSAVSLVAEAGATTLKAAVDVTIATRHARGSITASNLDLDALTTLGIDAHGNVAATFEASHDPTRGNGLAALKAQVELNTSGDALGISLERGEVTASVTNSVATINAEFAGGGGITAKVSAEAEIGASEIILRSSSIEAKVADFGAALANKSLLPDGLRGAASVSLVASGTISLAKPLTESNVKVAGQLGAKSVRFGDLRVSSADIDLDLRDLPRKPNGKATVRVAGATKGDLHFGDLTVTAATRADQRFDVAIVSTPTPNTWRISADAVVALDLAAPRVEVQLGKHRVVSPTAVLAGSGGNIVFTDGKLRVRDFSTRLNDGAVRADATYTLASDNLNANVHVARLDLIDVDRALSLNGKLNGVVNADLQVARRGSRITGAGSASVDGLRLTPQGEALSGTVTASITSNQIVVAASAEGPNVGRVAIDLDVVPPRDLTNANAWQRLPRSALAVGAVTLSNLDVHALASLLEIDTAMQGQVSGQIDLAAGDKVGTVTARNLLVEPLPESINADLTLLSDGGSGMSVAVDITMNNVAHAQAQVSMLLPARPFDIAAWKQLDITALRGVTAKVDAVNVDRKLLARLGINSPWKGVASAELSVGTGLRDATLALKVANFEGPPLTKPLALDVLVTASPRGVDLEAAVGATNFSLLHLTAHADVNIPTLVAAPERAKALLFASAVSGNLVMPTSELRDLLALVGRKIGFEGSAALTADVKGTIGSPIANLRVELRDVGRRRSRIESLIVEGHLEDNKVTASIKGSQLKGGTLDITGNVDLANLSDPRLRIVANSFNLAPLARIGPDSLLGIAGILDADLQMRGLDPASGTVAGSLHLTEAELPITAMFGTLREADILLGVNASVATIKLSGSVGSGTVALEANAKLAGLLPVSGDGQLVVTDIVMANPQQPRITARANLKLGQKDGVATLGIDVVTGTVTLPEDEGQELHDPDLPIDIVFAHDGVLDPRDENASMIAFGVRPKNPWLDVSVKIRPVRITSAEFRGTVTGALTARIGREGAWIEGDLRADGGDVTLFERRYRIDSVAIHLDGGLDPELNIALVHEFSALTLSVVVRGRLSNPDIRLSGDPGTYTDGQLLSFLLGGEPGVGSGNEAQDAAAGVASSLASAMLGSYVEDLLPIDLDVLRYEAATSGSSSAILVGKWITSKLFFAGRQRLENRPDENTSEFEVEYWLSRRVVLEGIYGDRGYASLDLLWTNRW